MNDETPKWGKKDIAGIFNVPPSLIGPPNRFQQIDNLKREIADLNKDFKREVQSAIDAHFYAKQCEDAREEAEMDLVSWKKDAEYWAKQWLALVEHKTSAEKEREDLLDLIWGMDGWANPPIEDAPSILREEWEAAVAKGYEQYLRELSG